MSDRFQTQFRPVFGAVFDEISAVPQWSTLSLVQKGGMLETAMRCLDKKHGRPFRFERGFDFARVVHRLDAANC